MSAATIGALKVVLGLDSAQFENGLTAAQRHLKGVGASMQKMGQGFTTAGATLTAGLTVPLVALGFQASKAATEAKDAMGQVEASLASMGAASGRTKAQLEGLASDIMRHSLLDDDDVLRQVTANLLTFGRVSGQVFDRAQRVIVDYSAKTGRDLLGSTMLIGKALQDPVKGMNQLGRAGIILTDQQKNLIKSMDAAGNTAGAQAILLAELETQFRGSAQAAQDTDPYDGLRDSLNDLSESFGAIINTHLKPFIDGIKGMADGFNGLSPQMQNFVVIGGAIAAALGPALIAIGAVVSSVGTLVAALGSGGVLAGVGALLAPLAPFILPIAAAVAAVAAAFFLFKDDVMPVLQELWATAQQTLGPALGELFAAVGGLVSEVASLFKQAFESDIGQALIKFQMAYASVLGQGLIQVLTTVVKVVATVVTAVTDGFKVLGALLRGDFSGAWDAYKAGSERAMSGIRNAFSGLFSFVSDIAQRMTMAVARWLVDRFQQLVVDPIRQKVDAVKGFFFGLYDAVVGHSYVPDMVIEVGQWMERLQQMMVEPAARHTQSAADRFQELRDRVKSIMDGLLTDQERAFNQFSETNAELERAAASGKFDPAMLAELRRRNQARYDEDRTERLDALPDAPNLRPLTAIADLREAMGVDRIKERIAEMRDDFATAFADGLDAALRGDWTSVLQIMFGDAIQNSLRNVGGQIFDMLGLGSSGMKQGGGLGNIGSIISSMFGKLPKFATGGSILPGGSGGTDSQLVAFWKSPSERVDIGAPGFNQSGGAGRISFDMRGAVVTEDLLAQAQRMADESGGQAVMGARRAVPNDRAQSVRYRLGMRAG